MAILYTSGPYSAFTPQEVKQNIFVAEKVAYELFKMGFSVICPHTNSTFEVRTQLDDGIPYVQRDLEIISRFDNRWDALVMLPGWEDSKGAKQEKEFAELMGLKIWYWPQDKAKLKQLSG